MFDLGWAEMAVIMLVALIVIGPKDLPKVARTIGQWTGKARALARDFQRSLDDMAREAELDEIKKSIDRAGSTNFKKAVKDFVDPDDELERAFDVEQQSTTTAAKPSNVRKPMTPPATRPALPDAAEPAIPSPMAKSADPVAAAPAEKAPEAAAAEQASPPRG